MDNDFQIHDLDLAHIRRFLAVVDCGTFVAAAERLGMTQQALSSSIAKMETLAGVRFLDRRQGGRVALTVFGRLLLTRARSMVAMSERTMTEIGLLRAARGGIVTVGIGETMTGRHVATAISRYHRQQPEVQIRLIESYTESMIEQLIHGEVDFVIGGSSHMPEHSADLAYRHLFEIRDVLAVRREHPLAGKAKVELADLAQYTWMVPGSRSDVYEAIMVAYMRAHLPPPARMIRSDAVAVGTWLCVEQDFIITVSPDMVGVLLNLGAMTTLNTSETTLVRHACAITRRDMKLTPAAALLLEEIVSEAETTYPPPPGGLSD